MSNFNERVVTLDEIRGLIKAEDISPEKLFDEKGLKPIRDAAKALGYAEGRAAAAAAAQEQAPVLPDHLNPDKNPWIKPE